MRSFLRSGGGKGCRKSEVDPLGGSRGDGEYMIFADRMLIAVYGSRDLCNYLPRADSTAEGGNPSVSHTCVNRRVGKDENR